MISVKIQAMGSTQSMARRYNRIFDSVEDEVERRFESIGRRMVASVRSSLKGPKHGKIYNRSRPPRRVRASAPGEAPAHDLGWLSESVYALVDADSMTIELGAETPYARILEDGGFNKQGYIAPRPYLRPALQRWRKSINKALHQAVKAGIKKGASI